MFSCYSVMERCHALRHPHSPHRKNFLLTVAAEGHLLVTICFGRFSLKYKRDWAQLLGHVHSGSVPYQKMVPRVIDYLEIALT